MPSELQRVARGLVDCFDEIPRVVDQLARTAARCRENAQLALIASRGQATVAAQQLDAAARACEAAAQYLLMAPPKARAWAEGLVGDSGPSTNRPSSASADRNRLPKAAEIRTSRLTATYEDLEVAEDNEPPVVTVARKAFEKYRKTHEKDEEQTPPEPLEIDITVTETGEIILEERNENEEAKRQQRLTRDFEFTPVRDDEDEPEEPEPRDDKKERAREERLTGDHAFEVDLTEAVKILLAAMSESDGRQWQHATFTITPENLEATFDYLADERPEPTVVDIELPELPALDFDPALDLRPIGPGFRPGVHDPEDRFVPKERELAEYLELEGWRIDARPEDHTVKGQKNPDATLRRSGPAEGVIVEFKTLDRASLSAVKRNVNEACDQVGAAGEVFVDGRKVDLDEAMALRGFRKACGQPGKSVDVPVHVILGDGRMVTFRKER
ncbi:hypothetical protein GCM10009630_65420 [Kribbella jejuensis]|uniref:tRNA nuclease CdiA C-terminal domain-containing protein n=1 Tax=Kribbella jejuensis TaxID=236068 RepID=A0A542ELW6_9ACTN|nr:hypothetical protein [Kribbella jejuensis]TQJ16325.1 hypothetical protein FB475_0418 [Kribbella jejuensis]